MRAHTREEYICIAEAFEFVGAPPGAADQSSSKGGDGVPEVADGLSSNLRVSHDSMSASQLAAQSQPPATAFQAAIELLEACIASLDQPHLEDIVKVRSVLQLR